MQSFFKSYLLAVGSNMLLALTGCGGGGDSGTTAGPSAEGVYGGTLTGSTSSGFQMLVLENDEFWAMYGTQTSTQFFVAGFLQGSGASNNGAFTSSNARDFGFNPAIAGTASANYNATAKTISGSVAAAAGTVNFAGGPIAGSLYNYNAPAQISAISGAWSLTALTGEGISLTVLSTGSFSAVSALGCKFSGTITPRASGKNVFNVGLTFGASPCIYAGQPASGIAITYPLSTGRSQLILAGTNTGRTVGTAAFGTR
jgi:hypothetical protein